MLSLTMELARDERKAWGALFSPVRVNPGCRYGSPYNLSDCLNRDMAVRRDNAQEHIWLS